jgi:hypothetical protein
VSVLVSGRGWFEFSVSDFEDSTKNLFLRPLRFPVFVSEQQSSVSEKGRT